MNDKNNRTILLVLITLIVLSVGVAILIGRSTMKKQAIVVTGNSPPPTITPTPATVDTTGLTSQPATDITQQPSEGVVLTISQPTNNSTITSANITIQGKTVRSADVFINDKQLTADSTGNFSQVITLDEGENTISVAVNDAAGNYAEKEITVTYNLPQTP